MWSYTEAIPLKAYTFGHSITQSLKDNGQNEWVVKFNGLFGTVNIEVHVVHTEF